MADFPSTIPIDEGSKLNPQAGMLTEVADDGTIRSRALYATTNYDITLVHGALSSAERATLLSHFAANKTLTFNVVMPWGETYLCRYIEEPSGDPRATGRWLMQTRLMGKRL